MAYGPTTRTVNDVKRAVQRTFGDESGVQLEDADIFMWINDAQDEIVKRNRILKAVSTTATVAGQAEYSFSGLNILQIESLQLDGQKLDNIPFAQADSDFINNDSTAESGTPAAWWEWGGTFTIWPKPTSVLPIKLFYTKAPDRVDALLDTLSVPDKYYKQIVDYVLQQAYEMDEEPELSQMKASQFDNGLIELAEEERTAQQMTYPIINVLY